MIFFSSPEKALWVAVTFSMFESEIVAAIGPIQIPNIRSSLNLYVR